MSYNTLIVLAGTSLLGAASGMVGTFAVLRRRALMGDALAHAALPGLCLAFWLMGEKSLPIMLFGALLTGLLGLGFISALQFTTRIKEDAAIGIVLSVFFGAGIVFSRMIQNTDFRGSKAGLDSYIFGKTAGMILQDVLLISGVTSACLLLILLLYKEFKVIAFDPAFAGVQGWPTFRLDMVLMTMIGVTVVIGLPAVGVVMVAALLILPAAAARFWTDRLGIMLVISAAFGGIIGMAGTSLSARYHSLPTGPVIVLVGTCLFVASMLFAPRKGVLARLLDDMGYRKRVALHSTLRLIYQMCAPDLPHARVLTFEEIHSQKPRRRRALERTLQQACRMGFLIGGQDSHYQFTETGLQRAAEITRAARRWELFLSEYAESAGNYADLDYESLPNKLPPELVRELDAKMEGIGEKE